jgi:hypothetical protein
MGKTVPVHAIKVYKRRRGAAPLMLNLGTGWK